MNPFAIKSSRSQFSRRRSLGLASCLALLLLCASSLRAADPLHYLSAGKPDAVALLAPPPLTNSSEQSADLAEVIAIHKAAKQAAASEGAADTLDKKVTIFSFTPAVTLLQPGKLPKTEAFIGRVLKDTAAATDTAKNVWKRPRPYTVDPSLAAGKLEKSFGYPSGHSTEVTVLALVIAELFPDQRDDILATGRNIGWHRVELARHYPTDIYAGRAFAQAIVREMKSNPEFAHDFAEAQKEIADALAAAKSAPASAASSVH